MVHAWDLAVSMGRCVEFDQDVLHAARLVADRVPDGPARMRPGAAFGPALAGDGGGSELDAILRRLGRDPGWVSRRTA